ncbi:uncharacterized protein METZ01_LOCUS190480, partial [marine metagenome]
VLNGVGLQVRRRYADPTLLWSNDSLQHPRQPTYMVLIVLMLSSPIPQRKLPSGSVSGDTITPA